MGLTFFRKDAVCYNFIHKASGVFVVVTNCILFSVIMESPEKVLGFDGEVACALRTSANACIIPSGHLSILLSPGILGLVL